MKRVSILGSTGSVGESAVRVIEASPELFKIVGLAAGSNFERLSQQIEAHNPPLVSLCTDDDNDRLCAMMGEGMPEAVSGDDGLDRLATMEEADVVLIAVSGAAGLRPAMAAAKAGKTIALANKESLVMAGELIMEEAAKNGATIIPVDSEHSGIYQALAGRPSEQVKRIILPASGGPFLERSLEDLEKVTPEEALSHPTWDMGKKITIDSATLMNKALELIEAARLFGVDHDRIDVIVHPQSIVHGMVEFIDGSVVAQLSVPDMRLPVLHALSWPDRVDGGMPRLDLAEAGRLEFRELDVKRFPAPDLARKALDMGGSAPAVFAAADEAAVEAFLGGLISFDRIVELVEEVLNEHDPFDVRAISDAEKADAWARETASRLISS